MKRHWKVATTIAFALALGSLFWLAVSTKSPEAVLPNPNGYDDFIAAAALIEGRLPDLPRTNREALMVFAATNTAALDRCRLGLTRDCRIPMEFWADWVGEHTRSMIERDRLGCALCVMA